MGLNELLAARGVDLTTLGAAYLFLLANLVATTTLFMLSRAFLVITPNRSAKHYGLYVVVVLISLIVATGLENELVPLQSTKLQYAALPHLVILLMIHLWIYYEQEPWLVALGGSSIAGDTLVVAVASGVSDQVQMAHWMALALLCGLLVFLWFYCISTKRGFVTADSIYLDSKELGKDSAEPQKAWLGLPQWVALTCASLVLTSINLVLRGNGVAEVPAVQVLVDSSVLLAITALVCSIPALTYWFAHKNWMPELTRFVWLVWMVVSFAFTYGNYLTSLSV